MSADDQLTIILNNKPYPSIKKVKFTISQITEKDREAFRDFVSIFKKFKKFKWLKDNTICICTYQTPEEAAEIIEHFNGTEFHGLYVKCGWDMQIPRWYRRKKAIQLRHAAELEELQNEANEHIAEMMRISREKNNAAKRGYSEMQK